MGDARNISESKAYKVIYLVQYGIGSFKKRATGLFTVDSRYREHPREPKVFEITRGLR